MGDNRNTFIALALIALIIIGYDALVLGPAREQARLAQEQAQAQAETGAPTPAASDAGLPRVDPETGLPSPRGASASGDTAGLAPGAVTRDQALSASARIPIDAPGVDGGLALNGARFDDLNLKRYRTSLEDDAPEVTLLSPQGAPDAYFANFGWLSGAGVAAELPGLNTPWRVVSGDVLTAQTPVVVGYETAEGLVFERTVSVDEDYLFTVTDTVRNTGDQAVSLSPYALIRRYGVPETSRAGFILHEGLIGILNGRLEDRKWKKQIKDGTFEVDTTGGWLGMTSKYWLAALVPPADQSVKAEYRTLTLGGETVFQTSWVGGLTELAPGESLEVGSRLFAGAKKVDVLKRYQKDGGIERFDMAIDWGNFWFFTRTFFDGLSFFEGVFGNFGVAILLLTVVIKLAFFPLQTASYKAMAKMRAMQPKMTEIRERFEADKERQQKEIMALYQREKVNPVAGCLPILIQIPVFFALYKVLFVTLEMRHAPFFGWIQDLSAPDPTSVFNIFGLLPYDPTLVPVIGTTILALGAWPLIMGVSMAAQMSLNPPPPDPTQQMIFKVMPWLFMFMLANFAAGLVIYWTWNNILSGLQQYVIMRRQGVRSPIDEFFAKHFGKQTRGAAGGGG
ncbi:MAG: membrane protein insertase YidC [Maricaulaceae bacterium]